MSGRLLLERGRDAPAQVSRQCAAACEYATRDALFEARHDARYFGQPGLRDGERGAELRYRADEATRIGMARRAEQRRDGRLLYLAACIHHHHALGDFGHHAEVMGDKDDGRTEALLEVGHETEDLRLDGDVERGGRLIRNQELGAAGQRNRDHHALAHAAGQLMRVLARAPTRLGDADKAEHLHHTLVHLLAVKSLMQPQRLSDLAADGEDWIEACHRLLEDHADVVAAALAHGGFAKLEEVSALKTDRARNTAGRLRHQPQNGICGDRLSATALADDRDRLTSLHRERDAVDRAVHPLRRAEVGLQVFDFHHWHAERSLT